MPNTIQETDLHRPFVSTRLCQDLVDAGFTFKPTHRWLNYYEEWVLATDAFDSDGYYATSINLLPEVPAFTGADCEKRLPDYVLSKLGRCYYLNLRLFNRVPGIQSERLPDAFAEMLLECIKKGVIDVTKLYEPGSNSD